MEGSHGRLTLSTYLQPTKKGETSETHGTELLMGPQPHFVGPRPRNIIRYFMLKNGHYCEFGYTSVCGHLNRIRESHTSLISTAIAGQLDIGSYSSEAP